MHAFCSVVRREGSAIGNCRSTLWMFASPGFCATLTTRLAPFALLVVPCVEAVKRGLNGRLAQFAASNGLDTPALALAVEVIVAAHRQRVAVRRVEHEPRTVDRHVDRADVERDAFQDASAAGR